MLVPAGKGTVDPGLIDSYPWRLRSATVIIGANEMAGFVMRAFVPNTIDDTGCLPKQSMLKLCEVNFTRG